MHLLRFWFQQVYRGITSLTTMRSSYAQKKPRYTLFSSSELTVCYSVIAECKVILHYVMDSGWFSSLCACASKSREWTVIYQARDWLRERFCIANITSEINCHFKKFWIYIIVQKLAKCFKKDNPMGWVINF